MPMDNVVKGVTGRPRCAFLSSTHTVASLNLFPPPSHATTLSLTLSVPIPATSTRKQGCVVVMVWKWTARAIVAPKGLTTVACVVGMALFWTFTGSAARWHCLPLASAVTHHSRLTPAVFVVA
jgi:hypothetical protein